MIRTRLACLMFGILIALQATAAGKGNMAPNFELTGTNGPVKLADFRGKPVYIDFWASWCGPCRQSFPWMNALSAKFGAQGLHVVGINVDVKQDDAHRFLSSTPAHFTIAFDPAGTTPRSYGIKGMPSSVLVGPDGRILFTHTGFRESDKADLENRIERALKEAAQ